jgi:V/A-type H+-transporting ATPase subunit E
MAQPTLPSSGVQELVQRLREEGVAAGRREAEQIVAAAREEAARVLASAQREAEEMTRAKHAAIETERQAARAALDLAWRDAVLQLREQLEGAFAQRLQLLVAAALREPAVLGDLVVDALRHALAEERSADRAQLLVGQSAAQDAQAARAIDVLAAKLSKDVLQGGVELVREPRSGAGVRVHLAEHGIELAVTDEALAALLLERLLPRFRAVFEARLSQGQDRG